MQSKCAAVTAAAPAGHSKINLKWFFLENNPFNSKWIRRHSLISWLECQLEMSSSQVVLKTYPVTHFNVLCNRRNRYFFRAALWMKRCTIGLVQYRTGWPRKFHQSSYNQFCHCHKKVKTELILRKSNRFTFSKRSKWNEMLTKTADSSKVNKK